MADKEAEEEGQQQQPVHPLACTSCHARRDEEAAAASQRRSKLKKRLKFYFYIVALTALETGLILLFALTILKFRTPKFRVRSANLNTLSVGNTTNPSFIVTLKAEFSVKNTNFGHYKYENTTVYFYYWDVKIGRAFVRGARARARSTRKISINVKLTSTNIPTNSLAFVQDLGSGILPISMQSKLRGRITILKLLKNNRSTNMNCNMDVFVKKKQLKNLTCK